MSTHSDRPGAMLLEPSRPVIRIVQHDQSSINMPSSELRGGPQRSPPLATINDEDGSSRRVQRTQLTYSESVQRSADNHEHNKRRRVDSQHYNVHLVGTSSMQGPVAHPPLSPLVSTSNCPVCMGPLRAASPMMMPVAPPPPQLPTIYCPICFEPLVEPTATRCGHLFCDSCIRASVAVQARCPVCRSYVAHWELNRLDFPTCNDQA